MNRADCDTCSHSTIESLIIDGNRPQLLRIPKGGALIETGNGEGQTVRNCRLYEPRLVTLLFEVADKSSDPSQEVPGS